jgi:hypothetical protein
VLCHNCNHALRFGPCPHAVAAVGFPVRREQAPEG